MVPWSGENPNPQTGMQATAKIRRYYEILYLFRSVARVMASDAQVGSRFHLHQQVTAVFVHFWELPWLWVDPLKAAGFLGTESSFFR